MSWREEGERNTVKEGSGVPEAWAQLVALLCHLEQVTQTS